jgi:hypothetical protein
MIWLRVLVHTASIHVREAQVNVVMVKTLRSMDKWAMALTALPIALLVTN